MYFDYIGQFSEWNEYKDNTQLKNKLFEQFRARCGGSRQFGGATLYKRDEVEMMIKIHILKVYGKILYQLKLI